MVRPSLEYGQSVWQPKLKYLSTEIEAVQRRATKLISELRNNSYPERLRKLSLPSLEFRRVRGDMIDTYKYVHKVYQVSKPHFPPTRNTSTRGNVHKMDIVRAGSIRSKLFSSRVVAPWNTLPDDVVTASTVNSFKSRLDHHWRNFPSKYNPTCCQ